MAAPLLDDSVSTWRAPRAAPQLPFAPHCRAERRNNNRRNKANNKGVCLNRAERVVGSFDVGSSRRLGGGRLELSRKETETSRERAERVAAKKQNNVLRIVLRISFLVAIVCAECDCNCGAAALLPNEEDLKWRAACKSNELRGVIRLPQLVATNSLWEGIARRERGVSKRCNSRQETTKTIR